MEKVEIGLIGIGFLFVLLAIRVPIAVALSATAFVGIAWVFGFGLAMGMLSNVPYDLIGNWSLSAIPMFMFLAFITSEMGLSGTLFSSMRVILSGILPGNLAVSSVAASALFASASGSSVATAASMSRIAIPEMLRLGYQKELAVGTVATAGTLGSLIPPSILMVLYAIMQEVSIGTLFIAGVIPGLLTAIAFIVLIVIRVMLKPEIAPDVDIRPHWKERLKAMRDIWPIPLLILAVLGGIFAGVFTPTQAAAVGSIFALVVAIIQGEFSFQRVWRSAFRAMTATSSIFIITVGAGLFSRFMGLTGVPDYLTNNVFFGGGETFAIVLQICILYLVLGMFLDSIAILLLTLPILHPVLQATDINLIWLGIIIIKLLEIGQITPPVGLNVFVIKSALGDTVKLSQVFVGAAWFLFADIIVLAILIGFPQISLWLPSIIG